MQTSPTDKIASPQSNYEKYKDMFTEQNDTITMDSFYKLLVAEMSNQDPLEPTSNTEFISQLASFTSLQSQQENFTLQKQNYANSLVGQTVAIQEGSGKEEDLINGKVEYVKMVKDDILVCVNGKDYKLDSIKRVYGYDGAPADEENKETASTLDAYGAFAAGILGKTVMVRGTDENGAVFLDSGTASSLEIENGIVRVVVNGYAYDVNEVISVTDEVKVRNDGEDSEQETEDTQNSQNTQQTQTGTQTASIEDDKTEPLTSAESNGTQGAAVERTDKEDIQDLTEPDDTQPTQEIPQTQPAQETQTGSEWLGGGTTQWLSGDEKSELYNLFN